MEELHRQVIDNMLGKRSLEDFLLYTRDPRKPCEGRRGGWRGGLFPRRPRPPRGFEAGPGREDSSSEEHVLPSQTAFADGVFQARPKSTSIVRNPKRMPTYGYRCGNCGHQFEIIQRISEQRLTTCPKCQGKLSKMIVPVGISFKGSGFYHD